MQPSTTLKDVVVAGDATVDWNLIFFQAAQDTTALWSASNRARACAQRGGAAMLADLLARLTGDGAAARANVHTPPLDVSAIHPEDLGYNHSYAIWNESKVGDAAAWRVSQFLGTCPAGSAQPNATGETGYPAHVVVLDDANLGFRRNPGLWPAALKNQGAAPWVLLKLSHPVASGDLLTYLVEQHAPRLVVLVAANDLRLDEAQISRGLSWERVAQDTLWEISYSQNLQTLARAAHVVVSFKTDGAVLISQSKEGPHGKLFFDPVSIEDGWAAGFKGGMVGYNTCLAAAIAERMLGLAPNESSEAVAPGDGFEIAVEAGIRAGLSAVRALHKTGYQAAGTGPGDVHIAFPYDQVVQAIRKVPYDQEERARWEAKDTFASAVIRAPLEGVLNRAGSPGAGQGGFTILSECCKDDLLTLARDIVRRGPDDVLRKVPLGKFGNFLTIDRYEIEAYRTIQSLMREYLSQETLKKPLSIAVFGPPGAGKSFGIEEIGKSFGDRVEKLTFNLSQMSSPNDLVSALHKVRDQGLKGKVPLVFWDEFDSTLGGATLGWLRYFLAPMQDGEFLEDHNTHPTGRAIFVFAGGTSKSMAEFEKRGEDADDKDAPDRAGKESPFVAAKGPDFISRLKGFVDVLGPNALASAVDPYYVIRRAILLRALMAKQAPQLLKPTLQMDPGLIEAFLQTRTYRFGVRSIEAILAMSQLAGKTRYERSCLPPVPQLNLHVDGQDFMAWVQKIELKARAPGPCPDPAAGELPDKQLESLARAVHDDFCAYMIGLGYTWGEETDDAAKKHASLKPFEALPAEEQDQNRANAADIARKLAEGGYVMIQARVNEPPRVFPDRELDRLAEMEHKRWMHFKLSQSHEWHYGPFTDRKRHVHQDLLPWNAAPDDVLALEFSADELARMGRDELSGEAKNKDRELIRRIPFILARIGYTLAKLGGR